MKTSHIAAFILTGILALPAVAQMRVLELGHEVSPSMVTLPSSETGELTMKRCTGCPTLRLRASAGTRYLIDTQQVSLVEFKRYVTQSGPTMFVVMQRNHTTDLARIVVTPVGPASSAE
jgi:hypothetical protein